MLAELRLLGPGDEGLLFSFLEPLIDTSVFLISNAERAGLEDRGQVFQATYVAHLVEGRVTAIAAHGWNGTILLQGDVGLEDAARRSIELSGRDVKGLMGPWALTERVRSALGMDERPARLEEPGRLFVVSLDQIVAPALLDRPGIEVRRPTDDEVAGPLTRFRERYMIETLGASERPELLDEARRQVQGWHKGGSLRVLLDRGEIVSMSAYASGARGVVVVGGVWTPHEHRNKGYGRAVVAGSLLSARADGVRRSVLFTPDTNVAARHAYRAIGYEAIGEWGFVLFA
jgi:hypothetical protein